uniref:Uncharacterized protein n=1 Tax=Corvus moneduloides TaxID=1196302 RepID=A0A8C3EKQ9_CORMO
MKKDVGGGKKEPREIKKPEKTTSKSEGLKGEPGGIQEKSADVGKEVGKVKEELGKGKEMLKESKGIGKSTDKDQAKETSGKSKEMSKNTEKDQDKEASGESTDKDQVMCRGVIWGFGALMKFSGFMQLFPFPWAGPGLAGRWPRAWMGSRGAGVWNCPCPWGKGNFVQLSFPPAPAQFPSLLPAGSERRLVRSREGLAAPAGRVHARAGSGCLPGCALLGSGLDLAPWPLPTPQPALPWAAPLQGCSPASRSATQLKPDVGTPELPVGRVRVRRDEDGTVTEVDEDSVQRVSPLPSLGWCRDESPGAGQCPGTMMLLLLAVPEVSRCQRGWHSPAVTAELEGSLPLVPQTNPPSLDQAEDLAALISLNECSVMNTLRQRFRARLPCTYAGPSLVAIATGPAPAGSAAKVPRGKRDNLPPHICSLAHRAYRNLLMQRQDQAIVPLGHSGAGRTRCCQSALEYLVGTAGSLDGRVSVEKIQAMFTVLGAFGSVTTSHSSSSTRFSMVLSLDFSATGQVTAEPASGFSTLSKFSENPLLSFLAVLMVSLSLLSGTVPSTVTSPGCLPLQPEDKQRASVAFSQLRAAMGTLGITAEEQAAVWRILAGIYHLGAAGACKVGRKQFLRFESASRAAEVLGCDVEELGTAVFKHHLRHILAQVTARGRPPAEESPPGTGMPHPFFLYFLECVEGMASGLYEELFAAVVSLINRSFSSQHLSMASIAVVDTPGFQSPRQQRSERAATFEELCHNYVQERLQGLFYEKTFLWQMERYREENVEVSFDLPERSPLATAQSPRVPWQPQVLPGSPGAARRGLLWILDEEVLIPGSGDGTAFERLCSYFAMKGPDQEGELGSARLPSLCHHHLICHQLGTAPVHYDLTGWVSKAKFNLSAQNAIQVLQNSTVAAVRELVQPRASAPLSCRALAGLEGRSQAALHRNACLRKTFASSLAALRKRSVCAQIKLQAVSDALTNLLRRSQLHFVHCLLPGMGGEGLVPRPPAPPDTAPQLDVVALRTQLEGTQLLDALRLHRVGYSDRLLLTQFRRRFQVLAPEVMKKHNSAYEVPDESKAIEELFQALDLEKKSVAIGRTQVFLKPGVISRLEKQRDKLIAQKMTLLQAACKGFLSRQKFKRLKIQRLAVRCIQKNLVVFQAVRHWPWWQLLSHVRPLLSVNLAEEQLRAKEEEMAVLRRKLEKSEQACSELRQTTESLESKIIDLTTELSDERYKGDVTCQALDGERAERLRGTRELQELQIYGVYEIPPPWDICAAGSMGRTCPSSVGSVGSICPSPGVHVPQSLPPLPQLGEAQAACQAARDGAQRLRRRCQRLACELEDARVLAENQQSRSHELEKRQKKVGCECPGSDHCSAQHKEAEVARLDQRVAVLAGRVQELSTPGATDTVPALKKQLWDLEGSAAEQRKELERQTAAVDHLEQVHERLELEMERMKQIHQKELEDKDEELEDVQNITKILLNCVGNTLGWVRRARWRFREASGLRHPLSPPQIGHRDFDVEKRLRRDLRRTRALLADVQLLLAAPAEPGAKGILWVPCGIREPVVLWILLQVDEQLFQLQHERADLLKRIDEDQEDLNELMEKHKALIAQSATDIAQIRELQTQVEDVKKEKQSLQEKLQAAQARAAQLEQCPAERSIVSRQEARIRDLESQLDFQAVQMKRFEVLVLRLRDSIIQMGEELEKAAESEARERENSRYYQRRMEEMKADMDELVQRELESSRRRMELVRGCCSRGLGGPMVRGVLLQTPHNPWVGLRAPEKSFSVRCFVCSGSGDGAVPCAGTPCVLGCSSGRSRELLCVPLQPQTIEPKLSLRTLMLPFSMAGLEAWTVPLLHVFFVGRRWLCLLLSQKCSSRVDVALGDTVCCWTWQCWSNGWTG